jgi:hypothetical protein
MRSVVVRMTTPTFACCFFPRLDRSACGGPPHSNHCWRRRRTLISVCSSFGKARQLFEIWKPNRQARTVKRGYTLRIQVPVPFRLHWSANEWQSVEDSPSSAPVLGFHFVDIPIPVAQQAPIRFTFYWAVENRWEGRDYLVEVG